MKLGQRLQTIAAMVPAGGTMADIGTDHAYLPIYLVTEKIVTRAIAGDVHHGPYVSAKNAVAAAQLQQAISVRLGNGLAVLQPGEADIVVIAGMGGANIIAILQACPDITGRIQRLILQPMIAAAAVREWLDTHGWQIVDEQLVLEEGKLYQIMAAEPGAGSIADKSLYEIGPLLWQSRHPLLRQHMNELISHLRAVILAMSGSDGAVKSAKYREYTSKLNDLEEKLSCL